MIIYIFVSLSCSIVLASIHLMVSTTYDFSYLPLLPNPPLSLTDTCTYTQDFSKDCDRSL